jgi:capsule biosynthesis phosphatase
MKRIIIDLDHTLCVPDPGSDQSLDPSEKYRNAAPVPGVIAQLRVYRGMGFEIVINTSRNMRTYGGDVEAIKANSLPLILAWLAEHDVPYDEVIVGKPWCGFEGFYVDDRAVRPSEFASLSYAEIKALIEPGRSSMPVRSFSSKRDVCRPGIGLRFGLLPPCFLPNGTKRLFEDQIALVVPWPSVSPSSCPATSPCRRRTRQGSRPRVFRFFGTDRAKTVSEGLADALAALVHDGRLIGAVRGHSRGLSSPGVPARNLRVRFGTRTSRAGPTTRTKESHTVFAKAPSERRKTGGGRRLLRFRRCRAAQGSRGRAAELRRSPERLCERPVLRPVHAERWLDFGHLHTYYWSRRTELAGACLQPGQGRRPDHRKTGTPPRKIFAEASWFENLPCGCGPSFHT